jgi:glycerophosphoryl diester phosphodiesterase
MPSIYSPHFSLVTKELLNELHSHHTKVIPWTVNEPNKIAELKSLGVDGIISDYPTLFK